MVLHARALLPLLRTRLRNRAVTVVTGARQTGKTTLVRDLLPVDQASPPLFLSLDDPDERLRLAADPVRRLDHRGRLVVLDEVQKLPVLLDAVKLLADRRPAQKFLLLGSSQILLLQKVRETLAGRSALLTLWPLALIERGDKVVVPATGIDQVWTEGVDGVRALLAHPFSADAARTWRARAEEQLRWGGYPPLETLPESERGPWLTDYRRTYLERDLADLGRIADLDQFALAQNVLATRTGQLLSYAPIARDLGVALNTVKRYVRFLEISYQTILLRPLLPTTDARLVKSPKLVWSDTGLARSLAERPGLHDGPMFETHVADELLRWASWQNEPPGVHFHRTHAGVEVDLVVHGQGRLIAIEAKAASRVHPTDARPIETSLDAIRLRDLAADGPRLGLVVYRGREVTQLSPRVWAVPDWRLFGPAEPSAV